MEEEKIKIVEMKKARKVKKKKKKTVREEAKVTPPPRAADLFSFGLRSHKKEKPANSKGKMILIS